MQKVQIQKAKYSNKNGNKPKTAIGGPLTDTANFAENSSDRDIITNTRSRISKKQNTNKRI